MTDELFTPLQLGPYTLQHRVVLAPLTRMRADPDGHLPTALNAAYYAQRATPGGLLITEATPVSRQGHGHPCVPGIHTAAQVQGWRRVTEAVHARGGLIFMQLWHTGRVSHSSHQPGGAAPVGPSAVAAQGRTIDAHWQPVPYEVPRALEAAEIAPLVDTWAAAAANAVAAGFDGVEVHGANGYLIDQFLRDSINDRSDAYGGAIDNRIRFLREVMQAVTGAIGGGRTGLRLSPVTPSNDAAPDSDPQALHEQVHRMLAPLKLAYLHVVEGQTGGARDFAPFDYAALRRQFNGAWMVNNGYSRAMALQAVASGAADLVAFGKAFIANPDLGRRLREDAPLNAPDVATFYGGGAAGYTDYPTLDAAPA